MNFKEILKNIMLFVVVRIAVSISPRVGQKDKMSPFLFYLFVEGRDFVKILAIRRELEPNPTTAKSVAF
jgi:hypothetical protein